ncbi:MAG: type II secretion system ATPase GspE [Deltaproteobacteria bacterium]|nr:type II secretion system ATPase GspE [Deltaproteobacteria bacterium]
MPEGRSPGEPSEVPPADIPPSQGSPGEQIPPGYQEKAGESPPPLVEEQPDKEPYDFNKVILKHQLLGEILLRHSAITQEQLDEALEIQREKPSSLGEILLRLGYINERDLLKALGRQFGIPFFPHLKDVDIDGELTSKIPIHFAKKYEILPIKRNGESVEVALTDPLNVFPLDDIRLLLGCNVVPVLATSATIIDAINRIYERDSDTAQQIIEDIDEELSLDSLSQELEEPTDLLDASDEAPIIRLVNSMLYQAVNQKASDIHVEPFERDLIVRYRIDGILYNVLNLPKRIQPTIISRIKVMAGLNIAEKRLPQDGRIRIKIAGRDVDIRVSVVPASHGERIVMRLLDKTSTLLKLEDIGFSGGNLEVFSRLIHSPHGIILLTGPTGSGKTTTLYAALTRINSPDKNIITVEDPIEYQIKGIGQIQVNPKINLTFANGLRSIVRQDPDVIMVGEIRDLETAEIAIQASLTGHLVFSTLHTNDSSGAITRLVDMGIEPFLVSSSLLAIMAQRLVRTLCRNCCEPYDPSNEELRGLGIRKEELGGKRLYRAVGCSRCMDTGYSGRTGIFELLLVSDEIRSLIMRRSDSGTIKKAAMKRGMLTLRQDGLQKVLEGITTTEEMVRVTQEDILSD